MEFKMNDFQLDGKVALITGAVYGIGFEIAKSLAEAGATIVFNNLSPESVEQGLENYRAAGIEARGYVCDVTDEEQVQAMVAQIKEEVGSIDILVNNAGIIKRIPMVDMSAEEFRQEYRNVDLLLVDDIQFFAEKEATQEEFFHTFNALYNEGKQIVLTSDRLPNEIPKLQERLVSRFAWGLSVDITPPDLETRTAILRKKAAAERLEIPDDTLSYIAGQIDSNIRELEGALVRVQAFAAMNSEDISTSLAADALKTLKSGKGHPQLSILQIQEEVAKYYHIQLKDLKGKKRVKSIVVPRQIAMYLARELTDNSLPKIGAEFGGKDHTTVIHAHEKIQQLMDSSVSMQNEVSEIKNFLLN